MKITREEFLALKPCNDGIDFFDFIAPSGIFECSEWTALHAIMLYVPAYLGAHSGLMRHFALPLQFLVKHGLVAKPNFVGIDLRCANLVGANLSCQDLSNADLSYADLSFANLQRTNLSNANLRGAKLYGAKMWKVWMPGADLSGADLSYADVPDANLCGTNVTDIVTIHTNFHNSLWDKGKSFPGFRLSNKGRLK